MDPIITTRSVLLPEHLPNARHWSTSQWTRRERTLTFSDPLCSSCFCVYYGPDHLPAQSCSSPLLLSTQGFCTSGHCSSPPWLPKFPVLHFSPLINDSSQLATCATGEVLFFWSCNATGIFIIHMISHRVSKWFLIILQHVPESQNSVLFNLCHYHHAYFCSLHLQSNLRLYFLVSEQCSSFRCSPSFPASVGPLSNRMMRCTTTC